MLAPRQTDRVPLQAPKWGPEGQTEYPHGAHACPRTDRAPSRGPPLPQDRQTEHHHGPMLAPGQTEHPRRTMLAGALPPSRTRPCPGPRRTCSRRQAQGAVGSVRPSHSHGQRRTECRRTRPASPAAHDAHHVFDGPQPAHPSLPTPVPVPSDACWGLTDARQLVSPSPCFSLPQAPSEGVGQPTSVFLLRQGVIQASPRPLSLFIFSPELSQALGPARVLPCLVSTHAQSNWTLSSSHIQRDQEKSGGP